MHVFASILNLKISFIFSNWTHVPWKHVLAETEISSKSSRKFKNYLSSSRLGTYDFKHSSEGFSCHLWSNDHNSFISTHVLYFFLYLWMSFFYDNLMSKEVDQSEKVQRSLTNGIRSLESMFYWKNLICLV